MLNYTFCFSDFFGMKDFDSLTIFINVWFRQWFKDQKLMKLVLYINFWSCLYFFFIIDRYLLLRYHPIIKWRHSGHAFIFSLYWFSWTIILCELIAFMEGNIFLLIFLSCRLTDTKLWKYCSNFCSDNWTVLLTLLPQCLSSLFYGTP